LLNFYDASIDFLEHQCKYEVVM